MLSDYFRSLQTIDRLQNGPVGPFIEGFAAELETSGFSRITIRAHIGVSSHLCCWTRAQNIAIFPLVFTIAGLCQNNAADPYKATLDRLNSLTNQPESEWRFHDDIPHPEDPGLSDTDWGAWMNHRR